MSESLLLILYVLEGHEPVPAADTLTWAEWFESSSNRTVARTAVGDATVSTVFLGINQRWGDGPPILFETMVFDGPRGGEGARCCTWDEAEQLHARFVASLLGGLH